MATSPGSGSGVVGLSWGPFLGDIITVYRTPTIQKGALFFSAVARGTIREIKGRKVITDIAVFADGRETANGRVISVQAREDFMERLKAFES